MITEFTEYSIQVCRYQSINGTVSKNTVKTKLVISESGISTSDDIRFLHKCGADAYLVGSSIMKTDDIQQTVQDLVSAI